MNTSTDNQLYCEEKSICVGNYGKDNEERFMSGGDGEAYLTRYSSVGDLYKACVRQYGRCISKQYLGEYKPVQVGWVFFKKATNKDEYDMETWITVYTKVPVKRVVWEGAEYPTFSRARR